MISRNLFKSVTAAIVSSFFFGSLAAQPVNSDQWAATDALGRKIREFKDAGSRKEKFVAIFYWTWHQGNDDTTFICNR